MVGLTDLCCLFRLFYRQS